MVKFTRRAVTAWLVSSAVVGAASAGNGRNNNKGNFALSSSSTSKDVPSSPLVSSWPWVVTPGGASKPLVLSKDEELESLEVSIPMTQTAILEKQGRDSPLFRDIQVLTEILLDTVKGEDENIYNLYFEFLKYGQAR